MSDGYSAYPEYRDSGLWSCPSCPSHWGVSRIKFIAELNPPKSQLDHLDSLTRVTFLPMEAIGENGELDLSRKRYLKDVRNGYTYLGEGDVCIAKITPCFENGKGAVISCIHNGIAFATTEVIPFRCKRAEDARFLYFLLTSAPFKPNAEASMYGAGGQKRVADSFVGNYSIVLPPSEERSQIAKFLDYETANIDALIAKQQQLIALLQEKRQAVISHAVTKGLNPAAPLRDSGVEWLGQVPAHWRSGKMKFFAELRSGHTPSRQKPEYWENCYIPWFSLADVWQLRDGKRMFIGETKEKISDMGLANSAADLLPAGTVILSRTASVGFSGIMSIPMATTQDFVNWIPSKYLTSEYLLFVFRGMAKEFDRLKMGSTHKTIYMPDVKQFACPVPPLDEQMDIVAYLTEKLNIFEQAATRANDLMNLLQERRTALISAAVTGKIDVRGWQPPPATAAGGIDA